jgi:hypothetical protein
VGPQTEGLIFVELNPQEVILCMARDHLVSIVVWASEPLAPEAKRPALKNWKSLRYPGGYLFGLTQGKILPGAVGVRSVSIPPSHKVCENS